MDLVSQKNLNYSKNMMYAWCWKITKKVSFNNTFTYFRQCEHSENAEKDENMKIRIHNFLMHLLMIINVPGFLWSFTSRYYEVSLQVVTAATKCVIGVIWQCGADIGNHRAAWLDAFCPASSPHHSSGHSTAQVKKEKIWVLSSEKHLNPMTTTHLITSWIMICKVCFFLTVMHTIPKGHFLSENSI